MTDQPATPVPAPAALPAASGPAHLHATPAQAAAAVGHLVCDLQGKVCWTDATAAAALAGGEVLLQLPDGRLGVRSHRAGLLALRNAMRLAALGTPPWPITLRHGHLAVQVGVHALPEAADGTQRVLLSLRPTADLAWRS